MGKLPPLADDASPVAREVHRRAGELGFSQKSLADAASVNETYVRDIFKGRSKNPKSEQFERLALALGCTVDDLRNPRGTERPKPARQIVDDVDELALISFWRQLSPVGRQMLLYRIHQLLPVPSDAELKNV